MSFICGSVAAVSVMMRSTRAGMSGSLLLQLCAWFIGAFGPSLTCIERARADATISSPTRAATASYDQSRETGKVPSALLPGDAETAVEATLDRRT
jgi:hypothetical protein